MLAKHIAGQAIELLHKPLNGEKKVFERKFIRYSDIVIAGSGPNATSKGTLVELKSFAAFKAGVPQATRKNETRREKMLDNKVPVWKFGRYGGRTTYHRQFFLDNVASTKVKLPTGDTQLADDFIWWFHTWEPKHRKIKVGKNRKKTIDNGIPMKLNPDWKGMDKKYTVGDDTDLDRVAIRLAQAPEGTFQNTVAKETLGPKLKDGKWYSYDKKNYQIPYKDINNKIKSFDWENILKEQGKDITRKMQVPLEIEMFLMENENKVQFIEDVLEGLDDYDVGVFPLDRWWDKLAEIYEVSCPLSARVML